MKRAYDAAKRSLADQLQHIPVSLSDERYTTMKTIQQSDAKDFLNCFLPDGTPIGMIHLTSEGFRACFPYDPSANVSDLSVGPFYARHRAYEVLVKHHGQRRPDPDLIPFCLTDDCLNPACEGDELCLECTQLRDAQPVRQEHDTWGNRGGCSYRDPQWELVRNDDKANDFFDTQDDAEAYARDHSDASWTLYRYIDGRKTYVKQFIATDITALYQRLDDGYRKQQFFARAVSLFALAAALVSGTGSASASDYTPTAPLGCAITHYWAQDDMSAIAVCAGGYLVTKQDGPVDDWDDIPMAIDTIVIGPDTAGAYHDWPVWD